jgi:transforming growth factor-beta-induced protein
MKTVKKIRWYFLGILILASSFVFCSGVCADNCVKEAQAEMKEVKKDIVDTAVSAGSFNTLAAALTAADLVKTLKGTGPFTVFAPTDEAFAKLPAGTLDDLLKPMNKAKLKGILTYHVVAGKVMAADVVKLKTAKTVNGQNVTIMVKDGTVMVDNAKVTKTDIMCTNGVIHIIDSVILPK